MKKINKKASIALLLPLSLSLIAQDPAVEQLKKEFKEKYNAHDADKTIDDMVQETRRKCGIERPIITLQKDDAFPKTALVVANPSRHPQEFMVVGTQGQTEDQIKGTIYHEMGHVFHGDTFWSAKLKDALCVYSMMGAGLASGIATAVKTKSLIRNPVAGITAGALTGGVAGLVTLCCASYANQERNANKERRADRFAYEKLVDHGHTTTALGQVADYLFEHAHLEKPALPSYFVGYPTPLERAKMGLAILTEKGVDINQLPDDLDEGLKANLPRALERHCPEFLTKKS